MDTFSHSLWGYLIFRNRVGLKRFLIGTILPDIPLIIGALVLIFEQKQLPDDLLVQVVVDQRIAMVGIPFHSLVVWGAFLLTSLLATKLLPLALGWGLHLALDVLTHISDATPLFWPLSSQRYSGLISYWEPNRNSLIFYLTNITLLTLAYLWIFYRQRRKI